MINAQDAFDIAVKKGGALSDVLSKVREAANDGRFQIEVSPAPPRAVFKSLEALGFEVLLCRHVRTPDSAIVLWVEPAKRG